MSKGGCFLRYERALRGADSQYHGATVFTMRYRHHRNNSFEDSEKGQLCERHQTIHYLFHEFRIKKQIIKCKTVTIQIKNLIECI